MASRRRSRSRTLTGSISDVQRRLKYLEGRPSPSRLGSYSVKQNNLQPRSVAADQLAIGAVIETNISEGAVGSFAIGTDAVGFDELDRDAVDAENVRENAIGTSELSLDAVYRENILTDAVGNDEIATDAVGTSEIVFDSIGTSELNVDAVYRENILTDAVGNDEIATDAVGTSEIAFGSVRADEIDTDAVGSSEIGLDAVGLSELANDSVDTAAIRDGAVTNAKIFDVAGPKITGTISASVVPLLNTTSIPSLDAGKITSGEFSISRIPNLTANKITSGTLFTSVIPSLDASKITSGTFGSARIPDLSASKITSGTFGSGRIPDLSAGKITSGTFSVNRLPVGTGSSQVAAGNHTHSSGSVPAHSHSFIGQSLAITGGAHSHLGRDGSHLHGITVQGFVGAVQTSSRKFKKDISDYKIDPKKLLKLELKKYKYKDLVNQGQESQNREWMYGYIAEDVLELGVEEIITYNKKKEPIALNYGLLSTLAIELLKSQQTEIDFLKEEIQRLKDAK